MLNINIATTAFYCPVSGERVRRGEAYLQDEDGRKLHLNQLPKRKLVPIKEYKNGPEVAVKSN